MTTAHARARVFLVEPQPLL